MNYLEIIEVLVVAFIASFLFTPAVRKLAMLEKSIYEREEIARTQCYSTDVVDADFKRRVTELMDKVRVI